MRCVLRLRRVENAWRQRRRYRGDINLYLRAESLQAILSGTIPLSDRLGALKFTAGPADNETLADAFQVVLVLRSPSLDGEGPEQALRRVMGSLLTELGLSQGGRCGLGRRTGRLTRRQKTGPHLTGVGPLPSDQAVALILDLTRS
jgi:hypothetical protein